MQKFSLHCVLIINSHQHDKVIPTLVGPILFILHMWIINHFRNDFVPMLISCHIAGTCSCERCKQLSSASQVHSFKKYVIHNESSCCQSSIGVSKNQ